MKIGELLKINDGLVYLNEQKSDAWMKVSRNIKKIKPHLVSFQDSADAIRSKYAVMDKYGKYTFLENGEIDFGKNQESANKDWSVLMEEEVKIDFVKISFDEITKGGEPVGMDGIRLEPLLDVIIE